MTGNGKVRFTGLSICLTFLGLSVGSLYSNSLLSLVVKEPAPVMYSHLKQILLEGYRIVVFGNLAKDALVKDLEIRNVNNILDAFYVCDECPQTFWFIGSKLAEKKLKIVFTRTANMFLTFYKVFMQNVERRHRCNLLPEVVQSKPYFWIMHTVNRNWIRITLDRLIDTRLQLIWTKWQQRAFMLTKGHFMHGPVIRDDAIGSRKMVLLLGIVVVSGTIFAFVCFIMETFVWSKIARR